MVYRCNSKHIQMSLTDLTLAVLKPTTNLIPCQLLQLYSIHKYILLPPREYRLPPVLYVLLVVGEDGVLVVAVFGLNSSASGFSLNDLGALNKCIYTCLYRNFTHVSAPVDVTSLTIENKQHHNLTITVCVYMYTHVCKCVYLYM